MSSKSIYSFETTNKSLSNIFVIEYTQIENLPQEVHDWSTMETITSYTLPFFSQNYRNSLLLETRQLTRKLRSKKNKETTMLFVDSLLKEINRQIGYLSNKHKETSNQDHMIEIRKLRKAKALLLKNKA